MKQLPLGVRLHDRAVFSSFLPGPNQEALAAAALPVPGAAQPYFHGPEGVGKSHLLQAICAASPGAGYFPLDQLRKAGAEVLEGLAGLPVVAIDGLEVVAGDPAWERQLFRLYNDVQATGSRLVVAAREPASALPLSLPDLRSRLAALPHYALRPLDEAQQREALRRRAALRGIDLPEETLLFLQRRFARDMATLHGLLDRLDLASLQAQRRLTVPFIREVLERQS